MANSAAMDADWQDRHHFFAVAAQVMRRVLVDFARRRRSAKRGGGIDNISLDSTTSNRVVSSSGDPLDLLALHDALERLDALDHRKSRILELRFFGGLTVNEIADVLKLSSRTVERDLKFAKAWLASRLGDDARQEP